jgi:hypothetical protein
VSEIRDILCTFASYDKMELFIVRGMVSAMKIAFTIS